MEDIILDEVHRDVFEQPKPSIDLDYLYSVKKHVQDIADETNSKLKKNVYQNYSLFIDSSREISTLKEEMRQLNVLLEQQQASMNKLQDQLNKAPIVQPTLERPRIDPFKLELDEETSEVEAEILPTWFTKSPEDFDVLIAQRNLREAVELAQRVKAHMEQYPKCCEGGNQAQLKSKVEARIKELVNAICSELQPSTDRSIQGGPRSSITSIQLLIELNLTARAVKLYLDQRSSVIRFVLSHQKLESATTIQFMKQICSIFFHNTVETCIEFKKAFDVDKHVKKALDEGANKLGVAVNLQGRPLLFEVVGSIYKTIHPSPLNSPGVTNGIDLTSHLLSHHSESVLSPSNKNAASNDIFFNLSAYASLTYWTLQEFENFIILFKKHIFNCSPQLSTSIIAESIYNLRNQCSKLADHCEINTTRFIERQLEKEIRHLIEESGRKLLDTINKLDQEEQWLPQQFQNKAQLTRFFEEMNDVDLKTMPSYIFEDLKLRFTACKTSFARLYLITVSDLSKVSNVTPFLGAFSKALIKPMTNLQICFHDGIDG